MAYAAGVVIYTPVVISSSSEKGRKKIPHLFRRIRPALIKRQPGSDAGQPRVCHERTLSPSASVCCRCETLRPLCDGKVEEEVTDKEGEKGGGSRQRKKI